MILPKRTWVLLSSNTILHLPTILNSLPAIILVIGFHNDHVAYLQALRLNFFRLIVVSTKLRRMVTYLSFASESDSKVALDLI